MPMSQDGGHYILKTPKEGAPSGFEYRVACNKGDLKGGGNLADFPPYWSSTEFLLKVWGDCEVFTSHRQAKLHAWHLNRNYVNEIGERQATEFGVRRVWVDAPFPTQG